MSLVTATVLVETARMIIIHEISLSFFFAIPWVSLHKHTSEVLIIDYYISKKV